MIDDCWCRAYGDWNFNAASFPDPKAMIDKLHRSGFKVMLWCCPFVSPDTAVFRELEKLGAARKKIGRNNRDFSLVERIQRGA